MWRRSIQFELLELLGEGGQGCVYKGLRRDRACGLAQVVAVKILHSEIAVHTWRQEFESLAKVHSAHCVRVLSFERVEGRPALVLEFVDGVSLAHLGQTCGLGFDDIQEIVAQLECALRDLHRQKVFHGDLSPQNVLVDRSGCVRVLDFGLANSSAENSRLTPRFAAPERLRGEPATAAADLYSLGKVEDFLRGGEAYGRSYLAEDPCARKFQDLSPLPERQAALARKVVQLQEKLSALREVRTVTVQRQKTWTLKPIVLALITCFMFMANSSASQKLTTKPCALLRLRTKHWHYFYLNGRPVGYSPLSLPIDADRPCHLEWISGNQRGERRLALKPFEVRVLDDYDLGLREDHL